MTTIRIDWQQLRGRQLATTTGAHFVVVRVTDAHVTIRPLRGSRNYALAIPGELERGVSLYAGSPIFPTPAELGRIGLRPILASYAWGVLKAVLVDGIGLPAVLKATLEDFVGQWTITEVPRLNDTHRVNGLEPPTLRLQVSASKQLTGQYQIGLWDGNLTGCLREFGDDQVVIFSYAGGEGGAPVSGGGWLRLGEVDSLEGEFLETAGNFIARRSQALAGRGPKPSRR